MKRVAWLTDIHLDFVKPKGVEDLMRTVLGSDPHVVVITGDIGQADSLTSYLQYIEESLERPIYFVLGNHDFYRGSIAAVRERVQELCSRSRHLCWLNTAGVVELTATTALVGHDSWCDGGYGDYERSSLVLSDFLYIEELLGVGKKGRRAVLERLGNQAATYFASVLPAALDSYRHVIVATHVPPFAEACCHEGRATSADALPYYGCKAVGTFLRQTMGERPDNKLTVLCGHTHCGANVQILPNLRVIAGEVEYRRPRIQQILQIRPAAAAG
jgi:predicted MPP superfamily phosphohydrolase